jgi:hypothetical protein
MHSYKGRTPESPRAAKGPAAAPAQRDAAQGPHAQELHQLQRMYDDSPRVTAQANWGENRTGMPDSVKAKMEGSFGRDFSDVQIHANSGHAAQMGALAYAQGQDLHFAPGQFNPSTTQGQQLLGHELAHVVQQQENRVQPTTEVGGVPVNDDPGLESEADHLGARAAAARSGAVQRKSGSTLGPPVLQGVFKELNAEELEDYRKAGDQRYLQVSSFAFAYSDSKPIVSKGYATCIGAIVHDFKNKRGALGHIDVDARIQDGIADATEQIADSVRAMIQRVNAESLTDIGIEFFAGDAVTSQVQKFKEDFERRLGDAGILPAQISYKLNADTGGTVRMAVYVPPLDATFLSPALNLDAIESKEQPRKKSPQKDLHEDFEDVHDQVNDGDAVIFEVEFNPDGSEKDALKKYSRGDEGEIRSESFTSEDANTLQAKREDRSGEGVVQGTFAFGPGWTHWIDTRPPGAVVYDQAQKIGDEEAMRQEEWKALLTADPLFGGKLLPLINHAGPHVGVSIREGIHADTRRDDPRKSFAPEARPHQTIDINVLGQSGGFHIMYELGKSGAWEAVEVIPQGALKVEHIVVPGALASSSHVVFDDSSEEEKESPPPKYWFQDDQVIADMVEGRMTLTPPPSYVKKAKKQGWTIQKSQPAQFVLDPNKWMLGPMKSRKQSLKHPKEWGETALHHKISKANLSDLGEALENELKKKKPSQAVQDFWKQVIRTAGGEMNEAVKGKERAEQIILLLWNMPANVELGPKIVAEDPGTGFDPNTMPDPKSEQPGARMLTPESDFLQQLEQTFLANRDSGFEEEHWEAMTKLLAGALDAHGSGTELADPLAEQWISLGNKRFVRRGLRSYPGLEHGEQRFQKFRESSELIGDLQDDLVNNAFTANFNLEDGTPAQVNLTNDALHHIYSRHTYSFWNPAATGAAKSVNTFWPSGFDVREQLAAELPLALLAIGANVAQRIPSMRDVGNFGVQDLSGVVQAGERSFFYFVTAYLNPDPTSPTQAELAIDVDTVAPSGKGAESYEPDELQKIGSRLTDM